MNIMTCKPLNHSLLNNKKPAKTIIVYRKESSFLEAQIEEIAKHVWIEVEKKIKTLADLKDIDVEIAHDGMEISF